MDFITFRQTLRDELPNSALTLPAITLASKLQNLPSNAQAKALEDLLEFIKGAAILRGELELPKAAKKPAPEKKAPVKKTPAKKASKDS